MTSHVHEDAKSITVRLESARAGPLGMGRAFTFDHVFDATSQQPEIFEEVAAPLVDAVLDGFNAVCFAYGQTGSGKTYTMHGASTKGDSRGLMVRSVERLLDGIKQRSSAQASYTVSCSFLQLYQETATDCLSRGSPPLRMREGDGGRVHVEGLRQEPISSIADAVRLIAAASSNRVTAGTNTNAESSRSHAVFTLKVTAELQGDEPGGGCGLSACAQPRFICDLAGSERRRTRTRADATARGVQHQQVALGAWQCDRGPRLQHSAHARAIPRLQAHSAPA